VIKWQFIEYAANAIIDRNHNGCGIVMKVRFSMNYGLIIERSVRDNEG